MKSFTGFVIFMIIIFGQGLMAQDIKFGHIDSDELIQQMPEFDSAKVKLEKFRRELINHLELMSSELNSKSDAFNKESNKLSEIVRQVKQQELMDMDRRIQEFQANAQAQMQERQAELFQPVYAKVEKAIRDTGRENGYLYIFNSSQGGSLIYFDKANSTDVTAQVKAKLKLK
jgi:outer membrane protein